MKSLLLIVCALTLTLATTTARASDDVSKFLAFFDKLADTVVADKADCSKMAGDMNKQIDENAAVIEKAKQAQAKHQQLPADARDHVMQTGRRMAMAIAEKCSKDTAVKAALDRLPKHGPPARH